MLGKLMGFIPTKRPKLAKEFYGKKLGLRFVADEPYALVFDSKGIMIRIQKLGKDQSFTPLECTLMGWNVKNIKASINSFRKKGIKFQRYTWMEQDDLGVWTSPSGAKIAWFKDPDGNNLSLTEWP